MKITSKQVVEARNSLGLSQAAVARATGISRNIMSAFEQRKIVMLDEMQATLVDFFESKGIAIDTDSAANDAAFDVDPDGQSGISEGPRDDDLNIRDGFCIPSGLPLARVDALLEQIHDVESQIEALADSELERSELLFLDFSGDRNREALQRLIALHARWACLVGQLHGRGAAAVPAGPDELDREPATHGEAMALWLTKEFGTVEIEPV